MKGKAGRRMSSGWLDDVRDVKDVEDLVWFGLVGWMIMQMLMQTTKLLIEA